MHKNNNKLLSVTRESPNVLVHRRVSDRWRANEIRRMRLSCVRVNELLGPSKRNAVNALLFYIACMYKCSMHVITKDTFLYEFFNSKIISLNYSIIGPYTACVRSKWKENNKINEPQIIKMWRSKSNHNETIRVIIR